MSLFRAVEPNQKCRIDRISGKGQFKEKKCVQTNSFCNEINDEIIYL